jgi:hypothetical protein
MMELDTDRMDNVKLKVMLACSSDGHATPWGEKGRGMWVEYYHEKC